MRETKILFKLLSRYRKQLSLSFISHILTAIFTVVSIPLIIPFFHFLFSTVPTAAEIPSSYLDLIGWLEYGFVALIKRHGADTALIYTCLFLVLTFFLKNAFRYLAIYFMIPVRGGIVSDLRSGLYRAYLNLGVGVRQQYRKGDLLARISSDAQEVEWSILRFVQTLFKAPIIVIGSVFLMLSIHPGLTLFVFVLMVFTGLVIGTLSKTLKRKSSQMQEALAILNSKVDESIQGALMLKIYRVRDAWRALFERENKRHRRIFESVTKRQELSSPLSEFLGVTVVIVLLWYGAQLVFDHELRPEAFFAFVFAFYHVIEPLKSFSTAFYHIRRGNASLERIHGFITQKLNTEHDNGTTPFTFKSEIHFKNISFAYGEQKVLNGISFSIKKGEKIALVGDSGAGKSTIVSLLLKNLKAQDGQVEIDGQELNDIALESLYGATGFVSQGTFLFNDTIRENITMGRPGIDDYQVIESLKRATAWDFVEKLPDRLDTMIGDDGDQLSGGEKQRLTIARALLEDPELLILDEPTSALDPRAEKNVSRAILSATKDRTALIIAHRLSTIRSADRILVLKEGQVVESGTHEELHALGGHYNDYVELQTIS